MVKPQPDAAPDLLGHGNTLCVSYGFECIDQIRIDADVHRLLVRVIGHVD
jgi:hypothetical protein